MKHDFAPTETFQILDEILAQPAVNLFSLNPQKTLITSFKELGNLVIETTSDQDILVSLRDSLSVIIYAQLQNFPENIFWDFDFMVISMLRQALMADEGAVTFLESFANKMVLLTNLFGIHQEIRFRYIHDFIYGFEWARWVEKEPQARAHIEPFSLIFLDYLLMKGQNILQRVNLEESTAYKLCETGFRNPFTFSREPEDEYRLLTHLAAKKLIPVAAWNWNANPVWNKPFQEMRQELALKLNIQPQQH
jgi:hypothetical protein